LAAGSVATSFSAYATACTTSSQNCMRRVQTDVAFADGCRGCRGRRLAGNHSGDRCGGHAGVAQTGGPSTWWDPGGPIPASGSKHSTVERWRSLRRTQSLAFTRDRRGYVIELARSTW